MLGGGSGSGSGSGGSGCSGCNGEKDDEEARTKAAGSSSAAEGFSFGPANGGGGVVVVDPLAAGVERAASTNGEEETEDGRERRLRDVARHVDRAMLRIARAHGLDLTPLMNSMAEAEAVESPASASAADGAATTPRGRATSSPPSDAVAGEPRRDRNGSGGRRIEEEGPGDDDMLGPSPTEEKDDDDDDDDLTGWNGVGVIGALLDDDAFSQSRMSSRRSSLSSGGGGPPLVLTTENYDRCVGGGRGGSPSECSGLSSPIAALQRCRAGGRGEGVSSSSIKSGASSRRSAGRRSSASARSRRSNGGAGGVFRTMPDRLLPSPPGDGVSPLGEEDGVGADIPGAGAGAGAGAAGVFNFEEWDRRTHATHTTFATCEQGTVSAWREEERIAAAADDVETREDNDDEFQSIRSRGAGGRGAGQSGTRQDEEEGGRERMSALSPLGLISPREEMDPSTSPGILNADRRRQPRRGTAGEGEQRLLDNDDTSVVSDAVSSLTSATTLFGRCDHGRDPAVVVGELWRIQGLLRSAMKGHGNGNGHGRGQGQGAGRPGRREGDLTMDDLRRNDFRMPYDMEDGDKHENENGGGMARERWAADRSGVGSIK
uniref:Uncharacterized protein n=1 Tax=Odontella aurita TaxID=265563 RepID=A0A7S4I2A0_9STRA|mmetsp:Transcript_18807/g.54381  ORF Transcript_18807/g.54381 Transcript_18807/m.54381 type:complete len:603 (+) Transcript_18807:62-1870(+)